MISHRLIFRYHKLAEFLTYLWLIGWGTCHIALFGAASFGKMSNFSTDIAWGFSKAILPVMVGFSTETTWRIFNVP